MTDEERKKLVAELRDPSVFYVTGTCLAAAEEIEGLGNQIYIAWAAGLFEGEGSICCAQKYRNVTTINKNGERRKAGFRWWLVLHSTDHDVLRRFHEVVGAGKIYGPYPDKRGHYKPQLRWATTTLEDSQKVLEPMLPYLGSRRKAKALECMEAEYVRARPNKAA